MFTTKGDIDIYINNNYHASIPADQVFNTEIARKAASIAFNVPVEQIQAYKQIGGTHGTQR